MFPSPGDLPNPGMKPRPTALLETLYHLSHRETLGWLWKLDHKEGLASENRCFWTVVLEKFGETSLDCEEIKPVKSKGNQPWMIIGRAYGEDEAPILWPSDAKSWFIGKDTDVCKTEGKKAKEGASDDETVSITDSKDLNLSKQWERVEHRRTWCASLLGITVRHNLATDKQQHLPSLKDVHSISHF